jgi:[ribosomal protein S5]-alanine N-acetyltransferase
VENRHWVYNSLERAFLAAMVRKEKRAQERPLPASGEMPTVGLEQQLSTHAVELYPLLSDPALYEFNDGPRPQSCAALFERFKKLESRLSPDGTEQWLNWVIRLGDGQAAGFVQATVFRDHTANIAYTLGQKHWGKGLALAAVSQMLAMLADEYSVAKLRASVDPRNIRSIRLLNRLGLQVDHTDDSGDLIYMGYTQRILGAL